MAKSNSSKTIAMITHDADSRKNIPTAEYQSMIEKGAQVPSTIRYPRNTDLDPQLVWRGKDEQDWSDLVVSVPPLYIQEKVHPKALIDDLLRSSKEAAHDAGEFSADLFADFDGIPKGADKTEFYAHDQNWSNRMILGDSLQVMASLAEREGLRGKVQCIYFDPPYGIKFNSNFQWSTTSRDVKDGKADHITREPEQVKAFRDTWRDGIHSYLTYLRDRLTVARDLLTDSGSIFVQIGDENVHRVRAVMDEVFGEDNLAASINFSKTSQQASELLSSANDTLLWYAKSRNQLKFRQPSRKKVVGEAGATQYDFGILPTFEKRRLTQIELQDFLSGEVRDFQLFHIAPTTSQGGNPAFRMFEYEGRQFDCGNAQHWKTTEVGMKRLGMADRLFRVGNGIRYVRKLEDFPIVQITNYWTDTGSSGFSDEKT